MTRLVVRALAAVLMAIATLIYATHRRDRECVCPSWDEDDDGWDCCA